MLNNNYLSSLEKINKQDPSLFESLDSHNKEMAKEISNASHTIRNMISFINCSYQFISEVYPETNNFEYWSDIQSSLTKLIDYTNRISSYRYSFYEPDKKLINLNDLLHSLVDSLNAEIESGNLHHYDISNRNWIYNLNCKIDNVITDKYQLKSALLELIKNGLDDTYDTCPITISSSNQGNDTYSISISYKSNNADFLNSHSQKDLMVPFFSTKSEHYGLGLSIVNNITLLLDGTYDLSAKNDVVTNTLTFHI